MAYTALYRKWRPKTFEEVKGQTAIVRTLKNQIVSGRVGHAYLFSGTRGTGKTSIAKIFARAVNCEHPVNGSPCNECESCKRILAGASLNVVEIDAASNNGVDNIREIREEVKYKPTEGKYRVYIIDEVHMLSSGAFNALLKTLEEPPAYVIFILATTEIHKIPITVLSRCQKYDFRRLSMQELEHQIQELLEKEGIEAESKAIEYIARRADGSSRDGLSLLEQCIAFYFGEKLTYENVLQVLGATDSSLFSKMLNQVLDYDIGGILSCLEEMVSTGRDLGQFVTDFIWYLRDLLLIQVENPGEEVLGVSKENLEAMREEAYKMENNQVMRYIRILSELLNKIRFASSKRVLVEVAFLKMMQPETEDDLESLKDRVRVLEGKLEGGVQIREKAEAPVPEKAPEVPVQEKKKIEVSPAVYEDYMEVSKSWEEIKNSLGGYFKSILRGCTISATEDGLVLLFDNELMFNATQEKNHVDEIKEVLKKRFERDFSIKVQALNKGEAAPEITVTNRISGINMEIEG